MPTNLSEEAQGPLEEIRNQIAFVLAAVNSRSGSCRPRAHADYSSARDRLDSALLNLTKAAEHIQRGDDLNY